MPRFQANRRILALLAVFFFVTTLYFCTTRLSAMSLIRQPLREAAAAPAVRAAEGAEGDRAQAALQDLSRTAGEHMSHEVLEGADGRVEADKGQGRLEEEDFSSDEKDEAEEEDKDEDAKVLEEEEKEKHEKEGKKDKHEKEEEKEKEDDHDELKEEDEEEKEKDEEQPAEKGHEKAEEEDKESESEPEPEKTKSKHKQGENEIESEDHKSADESQASKDKDEEVAQEHDKQTEDQAFQAQDPAHQTDGSNEEQQDRKAKQQDHNNTNDEDGEGEDDEAHDAQPHGLRLHASLPEEHVPTADNGRRLLIIGDIHGMLRPLRALLRKARFDPASDHIVSVGDMITKGPSSGGVVSLLMKHGASAVRGNHEDRVLLAVNASSSSSSPPSGSGSSNIPSQERKVGAKELETARALSEAQIAWLESLPAILSIEPLRMHVVHAGMLPGVRPQDQDPWAVMNMRTLTRPQHQVREEETRAHQEEEEKTRTTKKNEEKKKSSDTEEEGNASEKEEEEEGQDVRGLVALDTRDGQKWTRAWNRYQRLLERKRRWTVVYGHDAKAGLRETRYAVGLDSGCAKGGALTGMVVEGAEAGRWRYKLVQVRCGEDEDDEDEDDEDDE